MARNIQPSDAIEAQEARYGIGRRGFTELPASQVLRLNPNIRDRVERRLYDYFRWNSYTWNGRFDDFPDKISKGAAEILRQTLPGSVTTKIDDFVKRKELPFLIVRGLLPVPFGFPDDEWKFRELAAAGDQELHKRQRRRVRTIDAVLD